MKEKKVKILISLMTVSLLGLVALQYYLIQNLISIEEERFNRLVSEALSSVTYQIDKQQAASVVRDELFLNMDINDTSKSVVQTEIVRLKNKSHGKKERELVYEFRTKEDSSHNFVFLSPDSSSKKIDIRSEENVFVGNSKDTVFISKFNLVNQVVTELFDPKEFQSWEEQLKDMHIDSLLTAELKDKGIDLKHWFGVTKQNNRIAFASEDSDSTKIINSAYSVRIFPNNLFGGDKKLKVYFSSTSSYILSNIAGMLGLSILFIIGIGVIFTQSIRMLLRQKKITEVKNDLINNITHEFKTPLSTISIASEALADPEFDKNDNMLKKYTGMISHENKRLTAMVENLLNTAAFESGNYKLKLEELNIEAVIKDVVSTIGEFISSSSAEVEFNFNTTTNRIKGDEFHLANVFKNLIENAVKYCDTNPRIIISTENYNSSIVIYIKDNGIGISKENQKRVFDTFYRVPTGNVHDVKGNGIGLSYVKKMIEAHKGKIEIKSKLGVGSTFIITLPVIKNE